MTQNYSWMEPEEHYQAFGTVTEKQLEQLIDKSRLLDAVPIYEIDGTVSEVTGCFPEEDFLDTIVDRLTVLRKNLRGNNRNDIDEILEMLDTIITETQQSTEYGVDELRKLNRSFK